jgi:hypothetical protein
VRAFGIDLVDVRSASSVAGVSRAQAAAGSAEPVFIASTIACAQALAEPASPIQAERRVSVQLHPVSSLD